jgi:DNA-binding NtrC family response regulator
MSDKGELSLRVYNSYRLATMKRGVNFTAQPVDKDIPRPVGATMERIARRIPLILDSAISAIFIGGESGTGKEVVADLIGSALPPETPFIKVNCGAIAPTLLESELFGHVKGAFTGASADKRGLLEAASGGWIFLDEVATLSPSAQVALLRVLENHTMLRVGSTKPVHLDLRVLSATNEPLETLVAEGKFRADLWQRLRETEINLPPLRQRPDEIPALVERFCNKMNGGPYTVSGPAMAVLTSASWRAGNIRELRNCLRAMTEMHVNKLLTPLSIPERLWEDIGEKPETQTQDQAEPKPQVLLDDSEDNGIVIPWTYDDKQTYDHLTDLLLLTLTRKVASRNGRLSLRSLAQTIGM